MEQMLEDRGEEEKPVESDDALFDGLIASINNDGFFQKRFIILFNFFAVMVLTLPDFVYLIALATPDHWCSVPGTKDNTTTLKQWKDIHIPRKSPANASVTVFSSCTMYNTSGYEVGCQHGYEYDRQWFKETVPTQHDWVCDREIIKTNVYVVQRIAEIVGSLTLGQIGDFIGRRSVFYVSAGCMILGRLSAPFSSHTYYLFLACTAVSSFTPGLMSSSLSIIGMEMSSIERRSQIAFMSSVGGITGLCTLPLITWYFNDWRMFVVVSTLPSLFYIIAVSRLLIESPRWAASRGRVRQAAEILAYIAKLNGKQLPDDSLEILEKIGAKKETNFGFASLFSSWRLGFRAVILLICRTATTNATDVFLLNVTNLAGNPFLNFFIQALGELPGQALGHLFSERFGRRWTNTFGFLFACLLSILLILLNNAGVPGLVIGVIFLVKICLALSNYSAGLQTIEILPTCVRQSGIGAAVFVSNLFGISTPFIVYLGTQYDPRIPYLVVAIIFFIGSFSVSFLPETRGQRLPETLEEASRFGKNQKYWSFSADSGTPQNKTLPLD